MGPHVRRIPEHRCIVDRQSASFEVGSYGAAQTIRSGFASAKGTAALGNLPFLRALLSVVALEVAFTCEDATSLRYRVPIRSRELDRLDVGWGLVEDVARSRCRSAQSKSGKECHGEVGELHVVWGGIVVCLDENSG